LFVLQKSGKAIKLRSPEAFVTPEPRHRVLHGFRGEGARHRASGFCACNQSGIVEHIQVLHDGGQRHLEGLGQITDGLVILRFQLCQQGAPRGVSQCGKGAVEACVCIVNHKVKYYESRSHRQVSKKTAQIFRKQSEK